MSGFGKTNQRKMRREYCELKQWDFVWMLLEVLVNFAFVFKLKARQNISDMQHHLLMFY